MRTGRGVEKKSMTIKHMVDCTCVRVGTRELEEEFATQNGGRCAVRRKELWNENAWSFMGAERREGIRNSVLLRYMEVGVWCGEELRTRNTWYTQLGIRGLKDWYYTMPMNMGCRVEKNLV